MVYDCPVFEGQRNLILISCTSTGSVKIVLKDIRIIVYQIRLSLVVLPLGNLLGLVQNIWQEFVERRL